MLYAHNIVYRVCQYASTEKHVFHWKEWKCCINYNHSVTEEKWQNRDGCNKKCQYVHIRIFWWNPIWLIFQFSFLLTFESNYMYSLPNGIFLFLSISNLKHCYTLRTDICKPLGNVFTSHYSIFYPILLFICILKINYALYFLTIIYLNKIKSQWMPR